jgi:hypothetical protein
MSNLSRYLLSGFVMLLSVSSSSDAQIYKWVDAKGETHYSEKRDAGAGKAQVLKIQSQAASPQPIDHGSTEYWQEQERQFQQRRIKKEDEQAVKPTIARPKSLSNGRSDDTDQSRCNLAKDVMSGAVRHTNGAPIDQHDRDVAESDIKAFCH